MLPPQQLPKAPDQAFGSIGQRLGKPHFSVCPVPMALRPSVLPGGSLALQNPLLTHTLDGGDL